MNNFRYILGKAKFDAEEDEKKKKLFKKISGEIEECEKIVEDIQKEKEGYTTQIEEIDEWLREHDRTREAAVLIKATKDQIGIIDNAISGYRKDIIWEISKGWKILISDKVNAAIDKLEQEKEEQKDHIMDMRSLEDSIKHLNHRLEGLPCSA